VCHIDHDKFTIKINDTIDSLMPHFKLHLKTKKSSMHRTLLFFSLGLNQAVAQSNPMDINQ
jgi:hypothetical protein